MVRRRIGAMLVLLIVFMFSFGISYAQEDVETEKFIVDEKEMEIPVVDVEIEGVKVDCDVPPIVLNDRTLLPVRAVAEEMDCNVEWDPDAYEVVIQKEYKIIRLKIDSSEVVVNGETKTLPDGVPAKIVTYKDSGRTMVPARFILEELGAQVEWDASRRTVMLSSPKSYFEEKEDYITLEDIEWEDDNIRIKTSKRPQFKDYVVSGPTRLVVDIENAKFDLPYATKEIDGSNILKVRASQFETDPMVSRVVFDLEEYSNYDILSEEDGVLISFVDESYDYTQIPEGYGGGIGHSYDEDVAYDDGSSAESKHDYDSSDNPLELDVEEGEYGQVFELSTLHEMDARTIFLDSPQRIAVDVKGAMFEDDEFEEKDIEDSYIKQIRSYYYEDEDKTRITFTLADDYVNNELVVLKDTYSTTILKMQEGYEDEQEDKDKTPLIVLDAGHGGHDPGTTGIDTRTTEKVLALQMVQRLKTLLEEKGCDVVLTRDSDEFVELYQRAYIANELDADIFISVHLNAAGNRRASGIEVLYYPESRRSSREIDIRGLSKEQIEEHIRQKMEQNKRNNKKLAQTMQNRLIEKTGAVSRGIVERTGLVVTRETSMPAVLVELGFLSNPSEEVLLQTDDYNEKLANAMLEAIFEYVEK